VLSPFSTAPGGQGADLTALDAGPAQEGNGDASAASLAFNQEPPEQVVLAHGSVRSSPGGQYSYRILGPCCRLFDREELPWPCCRLAWRSKEPSWRRIGRRFVADLAARRCPSYAVELLQPGARPTVTVITLFPHRLAPALQEWWYSKLPASLEATNVEAPTAAGQFIEPVESAEQEKSPR
jgi:hypothetical protein